MNKEFEIKLKILKLYKDLLLNKNSSIFKIIDMYKEYLKLSICLGTNSPVFEENLKKYNHINCYGYALGLTQPQIFYNKYYKIEREGMSHNLGMMTQRYSTRNVDKQIELFYKDLEALNIKWYESDIEKENMHGGYKIALYFSPYDFHFLRQNKDGLWSEKAGYSRRINIINKPQSEMGSYKLTKVLEIVKPVVK